MKIDYERLISDILLFAFFALCDVAPVAWGITKIHESNKLYNECMATQHEMFACWDYRQATEGWLLFTVLLGVVCLMMWIFEKTFWTKLTLKTIKQLLSRIYKFVADKIDSDYTL